MSQNPIPQGKYKPAVRHGDLIFTAGMAYDMPREFFGHILQSGRTLTLHLYQTASQATDPDAFHIAYATASVLLILVFLLNRLASLLSRVFNKNPGGRAG